LCGQADPAAFAAFIALPNHFMGVRYDD
jgi:hypothetical protein